MSPSMAGMVEVAGEVQQFRGLLFGLGGGYAGDGGEQLLGGDGAKVRMVVARTARGVDLEHW